MIVPQLGLRSKTGTSMRFAVPERRNAGEEYLPHSVALLWREQDVYCAEGCAWTRRSGFKCKVLPAATYTFLSNCVRPAARTSMS